MSDPLTDFGYQQVPVQEKTSRVRSVFDSVASQYDLMNDVMSLGLHRLWKRYAACSAHIRKGQSVLDLAGGTGDMTALFAKKLQGTGRLVLADINEQMVCCGRDRLLNDGITKVEFVIANAELLPFPNDFFHCVFIGFGLRNVTNKALALKSIHRVLRPGGRLVILEFSHPHAGLQFFYDQYSFKAVPALGEWIANDRASYQYLVESIRMHPDQATLAQMLVDADFSRVKYENLTGGIVALHTGYKV